MNHGLKKIKSTSGWARLASQGSLLKPTVLGEGMLGDTVPGRTPAALRLLPLHPISTRFGSGVDVEVGATRVQDCVFDVDSGRLQ